MNIKLLLIAIPLVIMDGQAMDTSNIMKNQITMVSDNDILQNNRIQDLSRVANYKGNFELFSQYVNNFCSFVCEDQELLSKFLALTEHINPKLFESNSAGQILWDIIKFAPICNEEKIIKLIKEILNMTIENKLHNEQNIEVDNTIYNINLQMNSLNEKLASNSDEITAKKYQLLELLKSNGMKINDEETFIQKDLDQLLLKGKELIKQYNNQNQFNKKQLQQLLKEHNMGFILKNNQVMKCIQEIVKIIDNSQELMNKIQELEKEQNNIMKFV